MSEKLGRVSTVLSAKDVLHCLLASTPQLADPLHSVPLNFQTAKAFKSCLERICMQKMTRPGKVTHSAAWSSGHPSLVLGASLLPRCRDQACKHRQLSLSSPQLWLPLCHRTVEHREPCCTHSQVQQHSTLPITRPTRVIWQRAAALGLLRTGLDPRAYRPLEKAAAQSVT